MTTCYKGVSYTCWGNFIEYADNATADSECDWNSRIDSELSKFGGVLISPKHSYIIRFETEEDATYFKLRFG